MLYNPQNYISLYNLMCNRSMLRSIMKSCRHITYLALDRDILGYVLHNIRRNTFTTYQHVSRSNHIGVNINDNKDSEKVSDTTLEAVRNKIIYSSVLEANTMKLSWVNKKILAEKKLKYKIKEAHQNALNTNDIPISLKYLSGVNKLNNKIVKPSAPVIASDPVQLPYSTLHNSIEKCDSIDDVKDTSREAATSGEEETDERVNWMTDYEQYDEREVRPWQLNYGTADSIVPVSKVPCGGCGALLHCQDTAIPGYLPSELFVHRTDEELRSMKCQRCHFLIHYNMALNVNVSADEYPRLLGHIRDKRALVILMVDMTDFPCSIWPGIIDIIGTKRPVVVVGNKVDLLPPDGPGFLEHARNCLVATLQQTSLAAANVKHVALVSASSGFGVEELITKLHTAWEYKGDVYLMGCTNVGKSTLFNALLQSDYCKVQAVDLIQRATTSQWPGTTLNLLKFPILRPSGWRMYQRTQRLIQERESKVAEKKLRTLQLRKTRDPTHATLIGHIGRTFRLESDARSRLDPFSVDVSTSSSGRPTERVGVNPNNKEFRESHWCYDTPGTVQPDQVINLLTTEELMLALPRSLLVPRTFLLKPGNSLLIAGLARLDFLQGDADIRSTVFVSDQLPVTICQTSDADEMYATLLGSEFLRVPCGQAERLNQWPGLSAHPHLLEVQGKDWRESAADVVLSSAGWVAITPGRGLSCQFRAWTPHGRGVYLRQPAVLRYTVNLRGARVRRSPAYRRGQAVYAKN